jgi:hypothetical protein
MTLSSMVVSRDWPEVSVLECILGSLQIGVDVEPEPERARAKLAKSKVDALIVDCDLEGSSRFLQGLNGSLNGAPLVILSSPRCCRQFVETDAAFVFEKPISVERAVHALSAARNLILDGRLRYHRHTLQTPVTVKCGKNKRVKAVLLNVSQGGVAVHTDPAVSLTGNVQLEFALPGCGGPTKIAGQVVWHRQGDSGIKFTALKPAVQRNLHLWLAQQYLTR